MGRRERGRPLRELSLRRQPESAETGKLLCAESPSLTLLRRALAWLFEFGERPEPRVLRADHSRTADRHAHFVFRRCALSLVESSPSSSQARANATAVRTIEPGGFRDGQRETVSLAAFARPPPPRRYSRKTARAAHRQIPLQAHAS